MHARVGRRNQPGFRTSKIAALAICLLSDYRTVEPAIADEPARLMLLQVLDSAEAVAPIVPDVFVAWITRGRCAIGK